MSLPAPAREALDAFAACPGWEQRARLLSPAESFSA